MNEEFENYNGAPGNTDVKASLMPVAGALIIAAATLAFYIPSIGGGFIWDDDAYVLNNILLQSLDGLKRIWFTNESPQYYPLVFTTFWIENYLWGLKPIGYHIVNVAIHSLNALLVWFILRRLKIPGAWVIGLIFAVHPVHVESVAWITERKNVLSGLFYLSALSTFLKFDDGEGRRWYLLSLLFFILALFSKTVACTLPVAILIVRWYKVGMPTPGFIAALIPFFAGGAIMGLNTARLEITRVGAAGVEWAMTFTERIVLSGKIASFYATKLFYPAELTFIYPRWNIDATEAGQWVFTAGVLLLGLILLLSIKKIGRGPIAALAFFIVTLFPALGFFDVYPFRYSFVADHFQYLASLGVITLAVAVPAWALTVRGGGSIPVKTLFYALSALAVITLGTLTWKQGYVYTGLETLWRDTIRKNPSAWIAHNNLGTVLASRDRLEESVESYRNALRLKPDHAKARSNLGNALSRLGRFDEAMVEYNESIRLKPFDAETYYNIGITFSDRGEYSEALGYYRKALTYKPGHAYAHYNSAIAYTNLGLPEAAADSYASAIRSKPDFADAHNNIGNILLSLGRLPEAAAHYKNAIRYKPYNIYAYNNLGIIFSQQKKFEESISYYRKALKIDPGYSDAYYNLGVTLADMGRTGEAVSNYQKALEIRPDYADALNNLGSAYLEEKRYQEAVESFEKASSLDPENPQFRKNLSIAKKLLRNVMK